MGGVAWGCGKNVSSHDCSGSGVEVLTITDTLLGSKESRACCLTCSCLANDLSSS